jgi:NitT/TauT family transport system substrate-binding protein
MIAIRNRLVAAASLALLPLFLAGQSRTAPFTVAVNTSTIEAGPVYVAKAGPAGAGFQVVNGGVRNLGAGGAQAATNAETQMLLATTANSRIRMLFTVAEGHYRIIGRKSAGINALADLRGKKITTVRQTSAHYHLVKMLASAGVQESDVTLVDVERTAMARAVAGRMADAISMWEPEAQKAFEALGSDVSVFQNPALYRELFSLYTTTEVLNDPRQRRELVAFVRAVLDGAEKVRTSPQAAIPIIARAINQPEAAIRSVWQHHRFPAALPAEMLDVLTEEEQWVAKLQQRAPRTRDQLATFIDTSVLREVRQSAGRTP